MEIVLIGHEHRQGTLGQTCQNGRVARNCTEKLCFTLGPRKKLVGSPAPFAEKNVQSGTAGRKITVLGHSATFAVL